MKPKIPKLNQGEKFLFKDVIFAYLALMVYEMEKGRRVQKNGKIFRQSTIENYLILRRNLELFCEAGFELKFSLLRRNGKKETEAAEKHMHKFYNNFCNFFYRKGNRDNYVGTQVKLLKAFINYLTLEKKLALGNFHRQFYVRKERIPIITLGLNELRKLIYDTEFEASLPPHLKVTKDMFVLGCTSALRLSDLSRLTGGNFLLMDQHLYLQTKSQKTGTLTSLKLTKWN